VIETDTGGLRSSIPRPPEAVGEAAFLPENLISGLPLLGAAGFLCKKGTLGAGPGRNTPGLLDGPPPSKGWGSL